MRIRHLIALCTIVATSACDCGGPTGEDAGAGHVDAAGSDAASNDAAGHDAIAPPECHLDDDCLDSDLCTADRCDNGSCVHPAVPDGTPCGSNPCSGAQACLTGVCTSGASVDLDADNDGALTDVCGGTDCDDADATVNPAQAEGPGTTCSDGKDNDCDSAADGLDLACGATALCQEGWCWENPKPHGRTLAAVWPAGADDVWTAGWQAAVAHYDGTGFVVVQPEISGFPAQLLRMWGASANDVWAAGGALLHYDGLTWSADLASTGLGSFVDVWGFGARDVWAVGNQGRVARFDGIAWTVHDLGTTDGAAAVHGLAPDDVWIAGSYGLVGHFDGTDWAIERVPTASTVHFSSVWEIAPDDVWAGGDTGFMWHYDGTIWSPHPAVPSQSIAAIYGTATDNVWAVSTNGSVAHFNGSTWGQAAQFGVGLHGMRGRAADDIWAVGDQGMIVHYDGQSWSRVSMVSDPLVGALSDFDAVQGASGIEAWAVGLQLNVGGAIGRRDHDGVWHVVPGLTTTEILRAVAAVAENDVWVVGQQTSWHFDGSNWTAVPIAANPYGGVLDACASGPDSVWAVGSNTLDDTASILRNAGHGWSVDRTYAAVDHFYEPPDISRVFCTAADEQWAGGQNALYHREGSLGWHRHGMSALLESGLGLRATALAADDLWVMTYNSDFSYGSDLVHFDGREWTLIEVPEQANGDFFRAVAGTSASDVWLVGNNGLTYHSNGVSITRVHMPLSGSVTVPSFAFAVDFGEDDVLLGNSQGALFHWDGALLTAFNNNTVSGTIYEVYFASASDGWAIDRNSHGWIDRWDGTSWTTPTIPIDAEAIWGFASNDVWAVGAGLKVAHYDGQSWTLGELTTGYTSTSLLDVWGATADDVWALGSDGTLWRNQGSGFALVRSQTDVSMLVLAGSSSSDLWLFGVDRSGSNNQPYFEHGDGTTFTRVQTLESPVQIQWVEGRLFAVDNFAGVWERTSGGWQAIVPAPRDYDGDYSYGAGSAFFLAADRAFVSSGIYLLRFTGSGYAIEGALSGAGNYKLCGATLTGGPQLWAVGYGSAILHRAP